MPKKVLELLMTKFSTEILQTSNPESKPEVPNQDLSSGVLLLMIYNIRSKYNYFLITYFRKIGDFIKEKDPSDALSTI